MDYHQGLIKIKKRFFYCIALIFVLSSLNSFFRYTNVYVIFTPKFWNKIVDPYYFEKNWRFSPIVKYLSIKNINHNQSMAIETDHFDLFSWEFSFYPRKVFIFSNENIENNEFCCLILHKNSSENSYIAQKLKINHWKKIAHIQNDHEFWSREIK